MENKKLLSWPQLILVLIWASGVLCITQWPNVRSFITDYVCYNEPAKAVADK